MSSPLRNFSSLNRANIVHCRPSCCGRFPVEARGPCYRWLGKALAVLTDGRFGRRGCGRLSAPAARRECEAGAARMEEALVTFS